MSSKYSGTLLTSAGAISNAIGAYYDAKSRQYQMESKASSLEHQASMTQLASEFAQFQAATILEAGRKQIGTLTMRAGQVKGSARASIGGRGISFGVGSAGEAIATTDIMKEIDSLTINANTVKAAEAAKMRAVGLSNESLLTGASAQNLFSSAEGVNPLGSAVGSLLSSAPNLYSTYNRERKIGG